MTDQEFETIALALKAAYPNANVLPDKYAMKTWYKALADLDYRVVENAVWEHINTAVWPPRIAEIREKCADRLCPMLTDWGEAWEEVQHAIRRFGSYREEEAIASLSRLTAVTVRRMGFQNLCRSENPVADRAHFQRIYENLILRERHDAQLPEFVREERERLIESNTPPVLQIEDNFEPPQSDVERATPEHVQELMKRLRRNMMQRDGKS